MPCTYEDVKSCTIVSQMFWLTQIQAHTPSFVNSSNFNKSYNSSSRDTPINAYWDVSSHALLNSTYKNKNKNGNA